MAKRKKPITRTHQPREAVSDLGPESVAQHGDFVIAEAVRRRQRVSPHERLYALGRISARAWQAGEDWARDYALAAGARGSQAGADRVDGGAIAAPGEGMLAALARRRRAADRIGGRVASLLDRGIGEGWSLTALAEAYEGAADGRLRARVLARVAGALGILCGESRGA